MTGNYLPCPCSSEFRNANQKIKRVLECPNTPSALTLPSLDQLVQSTQWKIKTTKSFGKENLGPYE
ncbi:hypothetical protein TorRG33x02_083000 [Trema orientale]|uniref:Uncharacterized protein n=1 Tax=Trema orientale TaxID=63057 RepID=A0A2P5FE52_TREOI|nr:hypothetical protein TorRG33x02_083000 [Trema orientale]